MESGSDGGVTSDDDGALNVDWGEYFAKVFAEGLIGSGRIDPNGKTERDILKEAARMVLEDSSMIDGGRFTFDHEEVLLREARRYVAEGETRGLATMMYATYLEHRLNLLIIWGAEDLGIEVDEVLRVLRYSKIKDKTGDVFRKYVGKELGQPVASRIRAVAEARNEFVHYKWPSFKIDEEPCRPVMVDIAEEAVTGLEEFFRERFLRGFASGSE